MDQPYSRIADSLMDYQYWSPNDPQRTPYDDTGWTFPELFNVQAVRVADVKVLDAPVEKSQRRVRAKGGVVEHRLGASSSTTTPTSRWSTLRYKFKDASFEAAEEPFDAGGKKFNRGSFIIRNAAAADIAEGRDGSRPAGRRDRRRAVGEDASGARAARRACCTPGSRTQTEGWWRQAFDSAQVPFTYISTQQIANDDNLNAKFDVIVFPPVGRGTEGIVNGMPMWGNALPWKKTAETPNLGSEDQTDDMRPGLGWTGVAHLQDFVRKGGLLLTVMDTADLAVSTGFTPGLSVAARQRLRIVGSVVRSKTIDATSPIAYGYTDNLAHLVRQRPDLQPLEHVRRPRRTPARARRWREPADGTRHGRRSGRAAGTHRRRGIAARSRRSTRGRRCRSPTSSCATASTSSRRPRGRA